MATTVVQTRSELFAELHSTDADMERIAMEFKAQYIALSAKKADLLTRLQALPESGIGEPVLLAFDDAKRTIHWATGEIKLGLKPYRFVKALYFAKKRRLHTMTLEKRVWGKMGNPKSPAVKTMVSRLEKQLREAGFPCKIVHLNHKGHVLHTKNRITGEIYDSRQAEVSGYKLVTVFL